MINIDKKIEAILFFKGEPISIKELGKILDVGEEAIKDGVVMLERTLSERGICLMRKDDSLMLGTASQFSSEIEKMIKADLDKDLGKASAETLSIVLYLGPIGRSKIDHIRGVNSNFILRNLMIRGLVEKIENSKDRRSYLYRPTFKLLSYLGVTRVGDLEEYGTVRNEIYKFENRLRKKKK